MFCQNCGNELPEGAAFCPECGAKVAEIVTTESETAVETAPPTMEAEKAESMASEVVVATAAISQSAYQAIKKEETWKEKYFSFHGRLNRKHYILRSIVLNIGSGMLAGILAVLLGDAVLSFVGCAAISVAVFFSALSLCVRRLHDLNRSGFLFLLFFIPVINFFLAIYLIFFKGTEGENRYGSDPLAR